MKRFFFLTLLPLLGACSSATPAEDCSPEGSTEPPEDPLPELPPPDPTVLDERVVSYTEALRTASLKLVQNLPTLQQIRSTEAAADPRAAYEAAIDAMLVDPRFTGRMINWWRDTLRQGESAGPISGPSRDTAPIFAARIMIEERPYTDLFTATTNTCPTYDAATNTFGNGECGNGVATHAGVLTNPGAMMQFYSNMAFRRVRWVQEIFACKKFPAESTAGADVNGATYTAPWPFQSVASSPINFQDTSAIVCANCHATINHIAPLFANFDANGSWFGTSQVLTPVVPDPLQTEFSHWLNPGETTAWRFGKSVTDIPSLGKAMAADPDVKSCAVARMYNFAMSKEDIVSDQAVVPPSVLKPFVDEFMANGLNLKKTLRKILVSEDFVKF